MAPVEYVTLCRQPEVITVSPNSTTVANIAQGRTDTQALLYIVVTLLFYSLGIIIGIISYLKREKLEMQEDKTFEDFLNMKLDPFLAVKSERVQQFAARVQFFEDRKRDREAQEAKEEKGVEAGSPTEDTEHENSKEKDRIEQDKKSLVHSVPGEENMDTEQPGYAHKSCQTGDILKETRPQSRARKLVRILTPTPLRSHKKSRRQSPDKYNDKLLHINTANNAPVLVSPTPSDDERLSIVSFEPDRPKFSASQLTPRISLPEDDTSSLSTFADSPRSGRRSKSPMLYIDASTDDERGHEDRAPRTPLIQQ